MNRTHDAGWFGVAWWIWGMASMVLALIWVYVWPSDRAVDASALRYWLLRWGHALTWFALAAGFFVRQWVQSAPALANALSFVGLGFYIGFMIALLRS